MLHAKTPFPQSSIMLVWHESKPHLSSPSAPQSSRHVEALSQSTKQAAASQLSSQSAPFAHVASSLRRSATQVDASHDRPQGLLPQVNVQVLPAVQSHTASLHSAVHMLVPEQVVSHGALPHENSHSLPAVHVHEPSRQSALHVLVPEHATGQGALPQLKVQSLPAVQVQAASWQSAVHVDEPSQVIWHGEVLHSKSHFAPPEHRQSASAQVPLHSVLASVQSTSHGEALQPNSQSQPPLQVHASPQSSTQHSPAPHTLQSSPQGGMPPPPDEPPTAVPPPAVPAPDEPASPAPPTAPLPDPLLATSAVPPLDAAMVRLPPWPAVLEASPNRRVPSRPKVQFAATAITARAITT